MHAIAHETSGAPKGLNNKAQGKVAAATAALGCEIEPNIGRGVGVENKRPAIEAEIIRDWQTAADCGLGHVPADGDAGRSPAFNSAPQTQGGGFAWPWAMLLSPCGAKEPFTAPAGAPSRRPP